MGPSNIGLDKVLNATGQEAQNVAVAVIDSGSPVLNIYCMDYFSIS